MLLGNTLTCIEHPQQELVALLQVEAQGDRTLCGELDGILHEVVDNLLELGDIGVHQNLGIRELGGQNHGAAIYHGAVVIGNLLQHRHDVGLRLDQTLGLGLDL